MAGNVSLNTVTDGLVLYLDATNKKSLADVPSTNFNTYSENFTQSYGYISLSITPNSVVTPFGNTNSTIITRISTTANSYVTKPLITAPTQTLYTLSVYAKLGTVSTNFGLRCQGSYPDRGDALFNLSTGTLIGVANGGANTSTTGTILSVGNGWYRCSVTTNFPVATPNIYFVCSPTSLNSITGFEGQDGALSNCYIYGVQLEYGSVTTTYIPTTTVAVSRVPIWNDISRGGNNGTLTSGLTYNYSNGGSLVFNGATSFITIPNPINQSNLLQEWTVMAWINISDKTSQTLLGGLNLGLYVCYSQGNNSLLYLNNSLGGDYYTYGGDLGGIGWVLVTFIFKNLTGERYIYRNGVNITTTGPNVSSNPLGISPTLVIGQISTGNLTSGFQGLLSNIQIYNRALSSQEVLQNYNTTKSKYGL